MYNCDPNTLVLYQLLTKAPKSNSNFDSHKVKFYRDCHNFHAEMLLKSTKQPWRLQIHHPQLSRFTAHTHRHMPPKLDLPISGSLGSGLSTRFKPLSPC